MQYTQLSPFQQRLRAAEEDLNDALGIAVQGPQAQGAPMQPAPAALRPPQPLGALQGAPPPQPGMPPVGMGAPPRPVSPLQAVPSFRSPPMAAALQGPRGVEAQQPRSFARGGFAVKGVV